MQPRRRQRAHPLRVASFTSARCNGTAPGMCCLFPKWLASSMCCARPVRPSFSGPECAGFLILAPDAEDAGTLRDSALLRRANTIVERQGARLGQISPRGRAEMRGLGSRFAEAFLLPQRPPVAGRPTDDADEMPGMAAAAEHGPKCTVRGTVEATGKRRVLDSRDEFLGVWRGPGPRSRRQGRCRLMRRALALQPRWRGHWATGR